MTHEETVKDATHELSCRHSQNARSGYSYHMPCLIIKTMPDGRLKVLVFGERAWKDRQHKSRIRYVDALRVTERTKIQEPKT